MNKKFRVLVVDKDAQMSVGSSFHRGFQSLGHDSHFFDEARIMGGYSASLWSRAIRKAMRSFAPRLLNALLIRKAESLRPDLTLILKGFHYGPATIEALKKCSSKIAVYHSDDLKNPLNTHRNMMESLPLWDIVFSTRSFVLEELKVDGARCAEFLPFAYDPTLHFPEAEGEDERMRLHRMVTFVGTWAPERPPLFESIVKKYPMEIWGNGWEQVSSESPLNSSIKKRALLGKPLRQLMTNAGVNIALIRKANRDQHTMRTFEIPACGGFMIAERSKEHLQFFEEDKEAVFFETPEELLQKLDHYMHNEEARQKIAKASHARLLADRHTYADRAACILKMIFG